MAQDAIQSTKGLIEKKYVRSRSKSSGQSHALRLTARELTGGAVGKTLEPNQGGKLLNALCPPTTFGEGETDVVSHTEVRKERRFLRDPANTPLLRRNSVPGRGELPRSDSDGSRVNGHKTGKRHQQTGLATS
jgi:hypothetical protein